MTSLVKALQYLRLKVLISLIRLTVRLLTPRVRAEPDATLQIPSRDAGRTIKAHVYNHRDNGKPKSSGESTSPVLINFFGSGFAIPSFFGTDDSFCRKVAQRTGHVVLDVPYRLGPEHPFPAAIHDVEDVVRYVLSQPGKYDLSRISVSGFSSGGTLALVAPTLFPTDTFRNVVAFYPSVSLVKDPAERKAPVEAPKGTGGRSPLFWTRLFREAYLRDMDPMDPRISPLFADTAKYPRDVLIMTAEYDVSALEAEEFAEKLQRTASGRNILLKRMRGCGHNFDKSKKNAEARDEAYNLVIDMLKTHE
jgi:acetyl esterase/lipase